MWIAKEQLGKCGGCCITAFRTTFRSLVITLDILK